MSMKMCVITWQTLRYRSMGKHFTLVLRLLWRFDDHSSLFQRFGKLIFLISKYFDSQFVFKIAMKIWWNWGKCVPYTCESIDCLIFQNSINHFTAPHLSHTHHSHVWQIKSIIFHLNGNKNDLGVRFFSLHITRSKTPVSLSLSFFPNIICYAFFPRYKNQLVIRTGYTCSISTCVAFSFIIIS